MTTLLPERDRRSARLLTLTLGHDNDVECPGNFGEEWKPVSFCRRHRNFEHPDNYRLDRRENAWLRRKLQVGLAFWLSYYEHGLCRWSLQGEGPRCPWDSVEVAGILMWTGKPSGLGAKTYEDRGKDARAYLEEFTDWCNGDCYWFSLEADGMPPVTCGGLIGTEHLTEAINEALADGDQVSVAGEAAALARCLKLKVAIRDATLHRHEPEA
jgi:hypothetical protein